MNKDEIDHLFNCIDKGLGIRKGYGKPSEDMLRAYGALVTMRRALYKSQNISTRQKSTDKS